MTRIGIVYASDSKMIRSVIVPDNDGQLDAWPVNDGESLLTVDRELIQAPEDVAAQVALATGQQPVTFTCAVVDKTGVVVAMIPADPAVDSLQGYTLVAAPAGVDVGCAYDAKALTFDIPEKIIPVYDKATQEVISQDVIPASKADAVDTAAVIAAAVQLGAAQAKIG